MSGKVFQLCVIVLFVTVFFAGCATSKSTGMPELKQEATYADSMQVEQRIKQGNSLFKTGEFSAAEKIYRDLLSEYSSKEGAFETALLTNICLCNLETGDRAKFKDCAEKMKVASKNLPYLTRETQLVLKLNSTLGKGDTSQSDLRIESRIENGLNDVFKEGE
jgi:outer membrane PBP1 activator LpoA protein